jgi:predicted nucleotidyltransferase
LQKLQRKWPKGKSDFIVSLFVSKKEEIEKILKGLKPLIQEKFFVKRIGYFGSFAVGEPKENSDVDILVEFSKPLGWEFFDLSDLLEKELNRKVDLVSIKALKPQLKDSILSEVHYI